ncbi:MAG: hypothetical protein ORN58_04415, partial [Sediminibacterium sp.]|nr:hypothetical protein [Sediminibacterium sp.]
TKYTIYIIQYYNKTYRLIKNNTAEFELIDATVYYIVDLNYTDKAIYANETNIIYDDAIILDYLRIVQLQYFYTGITGTVEIPINKNFEIGTIINYIDAINPNNNGRYFCKSVTKRYDGKKLSQQLELDYQAENLNL